MRQKIRPIFLATSLAFLPLRISIADEATPPTFLFVQEAIGGTIKGPDDDHLKLTLRGVRNFVTVFADRPYRGAWSLPNNKFFAGWPDVFAPVPPNAVLSVKVKGSSRPV